MRIIKSIQSALTLVLSTAALAACSSDTTVREYPAPQQDAKVEPGLPHSGGGLEPGAGVPVGGTALTYPMGPYGHDVGTVVQNFKFAGFVDPVAADYTVTKDTLKTISLSDYYNPDSDPDRPIALLFDASARWCTVCQEQARRAKNEYPYWKGKGVEYVTAIFEDEESNPARFVDIEYWSERFGIEHPIVLDPELKMGVFFDRSGSPFNMIIDLRTMEIRFAEEGLFQAGEGPAVLDGVVGK